MDTGDVRIGSFFATAVSIIFYLGVKTRYGSNSSIVFGIGSAEILNVLANCATLAAGAFITLTVIERALVEEEKKKRSKLEFYALGDVCSSLSNLVVFAYMRIVEGDMSDHPPFIVGEHNIPRSVDSCLSNLCYFGGRVGAVDDMHYIVAEHITKFSSVEFLGGDLRNPDTLQLDKLKNRIKTFDEDTVIYRDELSRSIYWGLEVSDEIDSALFYRLKGLRMSLERSLHKPCYTAGDMVMLSADICLILERIEQIYAELENINMKSEHHTVGIEDIRRNR